MSHTINIRTAAANDVISLNLHGYGLQGMPRVFVVELSYYECNEMVDWPGDGNDEVFISVCILIGDSWFIIS